MNKYGLSVIAVGIIMISFGLGFLLGDIQPEQKPLVNGENKSVIVVEQEADVINDDTKIVFEQEYLRCGHVIISKFPGEDKLLGKNIDELEQEYSVSNGYTVNLEDNTLTIRQKVPDWCPADKEKCRLGEYQGRVAVFKGADVNCDSLLRVTEIRIEMLPADIADEIIQGAYEFENESALNDALENLDEYL